MLDPQNLALATVRDEIEHLRQDNALLRQRLGLVVSESAAGYPAKAAELPLKDE